MQKYKRDFLIVVVTIAKKIFLYDQTSKQRRGAGNWRHHIVAIVKSYTHTRTHTIAFILNNILKIVTVSSRVFLIAERRDVECMRERFYVHNSQLSYILNNSTTNRFI